MCKVLKNIAGRTARELLESCDMENTYPVNLDIIIEKWGLSKYPVSFDDLEKDNDISKIVEKRGHILGMVVCKGDELAIFYKKNDSLNRKKFTIAHEIAHCCLHTNYLKNGYVEFRCNQIANKFQPEIEKEANIFAGELLIPHGALQKALVEISHPTLNELARKFKVSENVMRERLNFLQIPFMEEYIESEKCYKISETDRIILNLLKA